VVIAGRAITRTFWGNAWCKNLEGYSDFANRLPRGRSYVRNGLVLHLAIKPGTIEGLVRGSSLYKTTVVITPISSKRWKSICTDLAGGIDSLVELLQGRFSAAVMDRICRQGTGLFPTPAEIRLDCSCPDYASMCKHVAAMLYGIGARLDERPELLFTLRQADASDLIAKADGNATLAKRGPRKDRVLARADLSELFGLEMATQDETAAAAPSGVRGRLAGNRRNREQATTPKRPNEAKNAKKPGTKPARSAHISGKRNAPSTATRGKS
jgi:uncharacterized Zn finger protein